MKRIALALGILLSVSSAHADWLSDVWPPDHAPAHGDPAITFNAAGGVIVNYTPSVAVHCVSPDDLVS